MFSCDLVCDTIIMINTGNLEISHKQVTIKPWEIKPRDYKGLQMELPSNKEELKNKKNEGLEKAWNLAIRKLLSDLWESNFIIVMGRETRLQLAEEGTSDKKIRPTFSFKNYNQEE